MSGTLLEDRLHELFVAQAASVQPSLGEWDDVIVDDLAERRDRRRVWVVGAMAAACVVLLVAVGWAATRTETHAPSEGGGAALSTNVVHFTADAIRIEVVGLTFSPVVDVQVVSDPSPREQTLELTWMEHGVEMRLFFYFSRDVDTWRVGEIRVYNGTQQPDWLQAFVPVVVSGDIGVAATGNLDLPFASADGVPAGRLVIDNYELQPFLNGEPGVLPPVPAAPPTIDTAFRGVDADPSTETKDTALASP